jgi:hypothetical protein
MATLIVRASIARTATGHATSDCAGGAANTDDAPSVTIAAMTTSAT